MTNQPTDPTPATPTPVISLREITAETLRDVLQLAVAPDQTHFVADNAVSIAQAHFAPNAWFRAIYADDTPVGFVMLAIDQEKPEYYIWRLMIDAKHQRRGYGRAALDRVVQFVCTLPAARVLDVSAVPGDGSPVAFYQEYGFELTGEVMEGELVLRLPLTV